MKTKYNGHKQIRQQQLILREHTIPMREKPTTWFCVWEHQDTKGIVSDCGEFRKGRKAKSVSLWGWDKHVTGPQLVLLESLISCQHGQVSWILTRGSCPKSSHSRDYGRVLYVGKHTLYTCFSIFWNVLCGIIDDSSQQCNFQRVTTSEKPDI